jgi:hypothetical protein
MSTRLTIDTACLSIMVTTQYIDMYEDLGSPDATAMDTGSSSRRPIRADLSALSTRMRLRGAVISPHVHYGVTHVVVDPMDTSRFPLIRERQRELRAHPKYRHELRVVNTDWAEYCCMGNGAAGGSAGIIQKQVAKKSRFERLESVQAIDGDVNGIGDGYSDDEDEDGDVDPLEPLPQHEVHL